MIKLEKISRECFRKFPESQQSRRFSGFREFSEFPEKFVENFPFTGLLDIREKEKPPSLAVCRTFCRSAIGPIVFLFSSIGPLT